MFYLLSRDRFTKNSFSQYSSRVNAAGSKNTYHATASLGESKSLRLIVIIACLGFLLAGCASNPDLKINPEDWVYEDRAISIKIDAPSDVNVVNGRPHALSIGVFQLSDPNTFIGLTGTRDGAIELLNKGKIDDTVADFRRITVQPGELRVEVFNRAQKAEHVGLIVGYYELNVNHDKYLFKIPVKATKRGIVEKLLVSMKLIANEAKALPDKLNIEVFLGRDGTKQMKEVFPLSHDDSS